MRESKNPEDPGRNVPNTIWGKRKLLEILYATDYWIETQRRHAELLDQNLTILDLVR